MARYQNPADINFNNGQPLPNGKLFFFEAGTSTPKQTFSDAAESVANPHPVLLDASGREPNIFYSGSAKVVLQDASGEQVWERDPVGGENLLGNFSDYNIEITYNMTDIVNFEGNFYQSLTNNNVGNNPSTDLTNWELIYFNYPVKEKQNAAPLENRRQNVLLDGSTFKLPAVSTVRVNDILYATVPDQFKNSNPTVEVFDTANDTLIDSTGTDTALLMNVGAVSIAFQYIDNNQWRILV